MVETYPDSDTCIECWGIVPPEGVTMVPDDGELCSCPIDVWIKFETPYDEEASHEANTYRVIDGYVVKWYHTAVGLVTPLYFETYDDARQWLESEGFQDFSS